MNPLGWCGWQESSDTEISTQSLLHPYSKMIHENTDIAIPPSLLTPKKWSSSVFTSNKVTTDIIKL